MKHQCFTSLLGEKASRRLHATPLATCRHSSSLRDNISSTGRHTSTSTMDVRSSLVERERLWRHLVARRGREKQLPSTLLSSSPFPLPLPPFSSPFLPPWWPGEGESGWSERGKQLPFHHQPSYHLPFISSPSLFPSELIFTVTVWKNRATISCDFVYYHVTHRPWYMYTDLVRLVSTLLTDVFRLDSWFSFSFNNATDSNC